MVIIELKHEPFDTKIRSIVPLFLPWLLSILTSHVPVFSFITAWLGSFFIFYYSVCGPMAMIMKEVPLKFQIMRPMVLIQVVFAGLMAVSSIFFFLDHLGFYFWSEVETTRTDMDQLTNVFAQCQRLYVFAHASLVFGMIIALKPKTSVAYIWRRKTGDQLLSFLMFSLLISYSLSFVPALHQFSILLLPVPKCLAALMILHGLRRQHFWQVLSGTGLFCFSLFQSVYSGYKEGLFVHLILLMFILYPYYKSVVIAVTLPLCLLLIYLLPTWNNTLRLESWQGDLPVEKAAELAYAQILDNGNHDIIKQNSWNFLTNRFSEIGMFSKYVTHVPDNRPYYGFEILVNALYALIPRAIWPAKPNTEEQSMERVYDAEVLSTSSDASAKTRMVVDGYLSAGIAGILITMVCFGVICQTLCNHAERLFGGYEIGCIVIFNGMFQQLWRGNNFEFLLNNIVYGFILMTMTFYLLRFAGLLIPAERSQPNKSI